MGGAATRFIASMNLHRRHLTEAERAMIDAELAVLTRGEHPKPVDDTQDTDAGLSERLSATHHLPLAGSWRARCRSVRCAVRQHASVAVKANTPAG